MPTTWNALYLGRLARIDPDENNTLAEDANLLTGNTYGSAQAPLLQNITVVATQDRGGTVGVLDQDNTVSNDRITFDIGAGSQTTTFDAAVQFRATLTYADGTTYQGTYVIFQDTGRRTFLAPTRDAGPEFDAMQAKPIQSITLDALVGADAIGLQQERPNPNFLTCFAAGTLIRTQTGDRAIETLRPGDLVATLDDGLQPLLWVGRQGVPGTGRFAPIRFRAGAWGNTRDLRVSPQHRMLVTGWQAELLFGRDEVLVPAVHLVNDLTIRPDPAPWVVYHHILLDRHQIVLSEGCPTESFFPGDATLAAIEPEARAEMLHLFPALSRSRVAYGPTARMVLRRTEAQALRRQAGHRALPHH